jgi:two-component system, cell cycle sensor histidine kinase and response regulator CckA
MNFDDQSQREQRFQNAQEAFAHNVAERTAELSTLNVRLQQEIEEHHQTVMALKLQTQRDRRMAEIVQRIRASLDRDAILNSTVTEVQRFLQVDRVLVYRLWADGTGSAISEAVLPPYPAVLGETFPSEVFPNDARRAYSQGKVHAIADMGQMDVIPCLADFVRQFGVQAKLVVPLLQGTHLWGLLIAHHCTGARPWQQWEIDGLWYLANQVSTALYQAELYRQARLASFTRPENGTDPHSATPSAKLPPAQPTLSDPAQPDPAIPDSAQPDPALPDPMLWLQMTADAVLVQDLQNRVHYWNPGAEQLYGWQSDQIMGTALGDRLYQDVFPTLARITTITLAAGEWQGELPQSRRDGKVLRVASRWILMRDAQGHPNAILTVDTDITAQKQLEAQGLRTQRIEVLGKLASSIAHDLNNVLTPILATAQLLAFKLPTVDAASQRLIQLLEQNAKRGADLAKQILALASEGSDHRALIQIKPLLLDVAQTVRHRLPASIEIHLNIPENLWTISANVAALRQVLSMLCTHARMAMPHGGRLGITASNLHVDIAHSALYSAVPAGRYLVLTVTDTGPGMAQEVCDRLFAPATPVANVDPGLSAVRDIVNSQGGLLQMTSAIGHGSCFTLYLPTLAQTEMDAEVNLVPLEGQGEFILVVDDEVNICEIVRNTLENHNYRVLTATSGIDAIALYAEHRQVIRLVLLDWVMPVMDGALTRLALQRLDPQIQILAMTGSTAQLAACPSPLSVCLPKPFSAQGLLLSVQEALASTDAS